MLCVSYFSQTCGWTIFALNFNILVVSQTLLESCIGGQRSLLTGNLQRNLSDFTLYCRRAVYKIKQWGVSSNDDGYSKDDAWKKLFQFTLEFRSYLDLFSRPFGLKPAKTKYLPGINFKRKCQKRRLCGLQSTQNLVISRCCFQRTAMKFTDLQRTSPQPLRLDKFQYALVEMVTDVQTVLYRMIKKRYQFSSIFKLYNLRIHLF